MCNFVFLGAQLYSFFCSLVCDFLFSGAQFCDFVFSVAISCVIFFFPTIQSSKCHIFAAAVYCFLTDSLKIFRIFFLFVF